MAGRWPSLQIWPMDQSELLNGEGETVVWVGSVPVGIDPVSLRFRNTNELWVVHQISDSVNIIDMAKRAVVALLDTEDDRATWFSREGRRLSVVPVRIE